MTETKLQAAASLPSGFSFEAASGPPAAGRMTAWTGLREPSADGWFASLIKLRRHRSQAREEAELRRSGHPGVLADYLSAKSHMR
jgi:hypothetical protein